MENYVSTYFLDFLLFSCSFFSVENWVGEAPEALTKLPRGGALRCDRISGRGEPRAPNSRPKPWFQKKYRKKYLHRREVGGASRWCKQVWRKRNFRIVFLFSYS